MAADLHDRWRRGQAQTKGTAALATECDHTSGCEYRQRLRQTPESDVAGAPFLTIVTRQTEARALRIGHACCGSVAPRFARLRACGSG
eukprot:7382237-Prymnesium_polylepis.3